MDFVKREDQNLIDEEQYKAYIESLQKTHQMETEYQHTPISMEQLHQAMQSTLNNGTIIHNFNLPLSPRQMSTLMLKTNLNRNLTFNEIPAHLPRNLTDIELVQMSHDIPQNCRPEDLVLSQNLGRNLDLALARNINNEMDLQSSLAQSLVQNLTEHDLARNLSNDLNRINDMLPQNLRADLGHTLNHEIDLSHHLNRQNLEQELLNQSERRTPMLNMQDNLIEQNMQRLDQSLAQRLDQNLAQRLDQNLAQRLDQNLAQRLDQNLAQRLDHNLAQRIDQNLAQRLDQNLGQRLVNSSINMHEPQRVLDQNEHLLPMPFHIKSEQEDEGYFYENMPTVNGHISVPVDQVPTTMADNQMYVYSTPNVNMPALNPIDLYTRPQNYINYGNTRENPQNLVVQRQYENASPYQDFKKFQNGAQQNGVEEKEQPKENLKPEQNKFIEYNNVSNLQTFQNSEEDSNENKLTISEDSSMIKGEYVCYKCNGIFSSKRGLKQHAKLCSENGDPDDEKLGKFTCSQCAYRCQSPAILKIHERVHTGEKPFSCTFCDYKSGQKNNVAKHILVHMKEKPFRCQYCDYRCAQKNNLVVHERTHTGFKPFACPYCDYRTVQKPNLVKHMYLHTDQKPFSCDQCSYRCVQKTNLTKHKQRHLNERAGDKIDVKNQVKPYRPRQKSVKCPLCPYRCVQKASLEKHLQFKHPDSNVDTEKQFDIVVECKSEDNAIQDLCVKKDEMYESQDKMLQVQS